MPTKKSRVRVIKVGEALDLPPGLLEKTYSAEGLKKNDPKKYSYIVEALSMGMRRHDIKDMFKVDLDTIKAVLAENQDAIKGFKKSLSAELKLLTSDCIAYLTECVKRGDMDPNKLGITIAILIDKFNKLDNEPDIVIKHIGKDDKIEDWLAKWSNSNIQDIESELIDHENDSEPK